MPRSSDPPSSERLRTGWVLALAAGMITVAVAVVGGLAWRNGGGDENIAPVIAQSPVTTTTSSTTTTTSATTTTTSTVLPEPISGQGVGRWYQVDVEVPDLEKFWHMPEVFWDLAETPVGFIATSLEGLWVSQDGVVWEPFARESVNYATKPEPARSELAQIASSELGTLVIARHGDGWFSPDARTWTPVEDLPEFNLLRSLAASPVGFVGNNREGRSWYSANGIDWQESNTAGVGGNVEATPFGFFTIREDGVSTRIWSSPDGKEWDLVAEFAKTDPEDPVVHGSRVAGSQAGIVAVGDSGTVWYSPDGQDWIEGDTLEAGDYPHWGIGASDTGFFAATSVEVDLEFLGLAAWYSKDGLTWVPVPYDSPQTDNETWIREVLPVGDGFLIASENFPSGPFPYDGPVLIYEP